MSRVHPDVKSGKKTEEEVTRDFFESLDIHVILLF